MKYNYPPIKWSLLMLFLFLTGSMTAQTTNTITVSGTVTDTSSNTPIPFFPVVIHAMDSLGTGGGSFVYQNVAFSDANGNYVDSITYPVTVSNLLVDLTYSVCNGAVISLNYSQVNSNIVHNIIQCGSGGPSGGNCTAAFVASPSAFLPTMYTFRPAGIGYASYSWDFGDGNSGTGIAPNHTYANSGTYTACLIVDDGMGCRDTACQTIFVGISPPLNCDASFFYLPIATGFQFLHNPVNQANYTYSWDFGDGNTSTLANPAHTYAQPDTYNVCLIVTAASGGMTCADTSCQIVINRGGNTTGCVAGFGYSSNGNTVSFSDSSTSAATYHWDFGDQNTGSVANPTHTYAAPGVYIVCLTITDSAGNCFDTYCDPVIVGNGSGPCSAAYLGSGTPINPLLYNFQALMPGLTYVWDLGDGTIATGPNIRHQYAQPDTYQVCLYVDDGMGCKDTLCLPHVVGNVLPNYCSAAFFYSPDTAALAINYQSLMPGYASYAWDFGDGSMGTGYSNQHTYMAAGTYTVCLAIMDSSGCTDTLCMPVHVGNRPPPPGQCNALFGFQPLGGDTVEFFALYAADTYDWDFGDGSTDTGRTVIHAYNTSGSYNVCLDVLVTTAFSFCHDSLCQQVVTNAPPPPSGFPIFGQVMAGTNNGDDYTVYLIVHDSTAGTLAAVDTFRSFGLNPGGLFHFAAVNGDYLVKASLNSGSAYYSNYMPTYYGDEMLWSNATVVNGNTFPFLRINLEPGINPGGPGFIGGLISQGANKKDAGDPLEGIHVLLLDLNDQPVAHTSSDGSGKFAFTHVAYGTYKVWVEVWGRDPEPYLVTISPNTPSISGIAFEVHSTEITALGTTSVEDLIDPGRGVSIYPNPASDWVKVDLGLRQSADLKVSLANLHGQQLFIEENKLSTGAHQLEVPVSDLPAGMYLLQLELNGQRLKAQKIVIK